MERKRRANVWRPGHPLANSGGRITRSRYVLYQKLGGRKNIVCEWCGCALTWETVCADHVNSDSQDDRPENLVASCRGCNANRADGTGNGRRPKISCSTCGRSFLRPRRSSRYCSNVCTPRPIRGSKAYHGTRSRYQYGCRCERCRAENNRRWREWSYKAKAQKK